MALTGRQNKFAEVYVQTGNAAEAYRQAYPRSQKWKDKTVYNRASEMWKNGDVVGRVKELQEKANEVVEFAAERYLVEQDRIAKSDFRKLFKDGRLLDPHEMPDDIAAAVASIKVKRIPGGDGKIEEIVEVKLWSKNSALDSMFKNKGLYSNDNSQRRPMVIVKDFSGGEE